MRVILATILALALAGLGGSLSANGQEPSPPVQVVRVTGHTDTITSLAFAPDGQTLATASRDHSIKLWNVPTGLLLRSIGDGPATIEGATFAADGTEIISITDRIDTIIQVNDAATGKLKQTIKSPVFDHALLVQAVAFSPDGNILAAAPSINGATTIEIMDAHTGESLRSIAAMRDVVLAYSPDGTYLAATGTDCGVVLLDPKSGARVGQFACGSFFGLLSKPAEFDAIAISNDGRTIAAASGKTLTQFDVASGNVRSELDTGATIRALAVSPDGGLVATASYDATIEIRDATGKSVHSIEGYASSSDAPLLAFSPDGKVLATSGGEALVRLWDATDWNYARPLQGAKYQIGGVAITADGASIAADDSHATVLWDAVEGKLVRTMDEDLEPSLGECDSCTIGFSADGRLLAAGTRMATTMAWDVASGRIVLELTHSSKDAVIPRRSVAFLPSGHTLLLSAMSEGREPDIKEAPPVLYDVATRTVLQTLAGDPETSGVFQWTYPMAVSPDGTSVAAVSRGRIINIFDSQSAQLVRSVRGGNISPRALAYSADGRLLASISGGYPSDWIEIWDVASGDQVRKIDTALEGIQSVAFSPDNRTVASAGEDSIITLWSLDDGTKTGSLQGHSGPVASLAFAANGNLISGSHDGSVKIWGGKGLDLLATMAWEPSGEWIVFTPEGFFEAEGRISKLGIVRGMEAYPIDAAYDLLHRPDLVAEKLRGDPQGEVKAAAAQLDVWSSVAPH